MLLSLFIILLCGQLDHFGFTTIGSPQVAGDSFQVVVYAYDASNQVVVGYNGQPYVYSSINPIYSYKRVSFTSGVCVESVMVRLASNMALICNDYAGHTGQSNNFNVVPNAPTKLIGIVPIEYYDPGTLTGKAGTVSNQTAGSYFNVDIYATDYWSNTVDTVNHTINVSSSDPFVRQSQIQLVNGAYTLPFAFRTTGSRTIYFDDLTNPSIQSAISSSIPVQAGPYTDLLVILPGEAYLPGDTTTTISDTPGKTGTPNDQYVLTNFQVDVYATDSMWNRTTTSGNSVRLNSDFPFSNPAPVTMSNGLAQFTVSFDSVGDNQNIWAEDGSIQSYRNYLNILAQPDTTDTTTTLDTLFKAFPNPLGINGDNRMYFAYNLPHSCNVILAIYDPYGNLVQRYDIASGSDGGRAGYNRIEWDGRNEENQRVASGVYYVVLKAWTHTATVLNTKLKAGVVW